VYFLQRLLRRQWPFFVGVVVNFGGMADVHDALTRSKNMRAIKNKNTKPEILVRKFLHAHGYRFRLHVTNLPGKPDIVLPKYKTAIFIQGCFWHRHQPCKYYSLPKTRTDWWAKKIGRNQTNDSQKQAALSALGWKVLVVWECELKPVHLTNTFAKLLWTLS